MSVLLVSSTIQLSLPDHCSLRSVNKNPTYKPTYVRKKRTRSYIEEDRHGIKWPIDRPTNTAADTATASSEASADAPDALVDAPE